MKSKFMDELTKDIVVENAKKVQEEEKAEAELLRLYSANELKSDIIKAPHHRF